jgi:DNA-binding protein Fis
LIALPDLPDLGGPPGAEQSNSAWPLGTLCFAEVERRLYETALRQSANNVSAAARVLGLERSKLRRRLKTLKIG